MIPLNPDVSAQHERLQIFVVLQILRKKSVKMVLAYRVYQPIVLGRV